MTAEPQLTRPCPTCGRSLIIRRVKQTGERFLGCETWPKCTHTEPLPEYFRLVEAGAAMLPGMEDL